MKQPFLYLDSAEISEDDLSALRGSGFIPIKVNSFDDVKVLDTIAAGNSDMICSMVDAFNKKDTHSESVRGYFARNLFARLADREPS